MAENDGVEDEAEFLRHLDSLGVPHHTPSPDSRRLGLDRNTEEGALVAFSGSLRPNARMHRAVAWVLLVAFGLPALFAVARLVGLTFRWMMP